VDWVFLNRRTKHWNFDLSDHSTKSNRQTFTYLLTLTRLKCDHWIKILNRILFPHCRYIDKSYYRAIIIRWPFSFYNKCVTLYNTSLILALHNFASLMDEIMGNFMVTRPTKIMSQLNSRFLQQSTGLIISSSHHENVTF
jgi:hypothetical protein